MFQHHFPPSSISCSVDCFLLFFEIRSILFVYCSNEFYCNCNLTFWQCSARFVHHCSRTVHIIWFGIDRLTKTVGWHDDDDMDILYSIVLFIVCMEHVARCAAFNIQIWKLNTIKLVFHCNKSFFNQSIRNANCIVYRIENQNENIIINGTIKQLLILLI